MRIAAVTRNTKETQIRVAINLDGKGVAKLDSGIPFLDLLPTLQGQDSASLWVHTGDLHPNEKAQLLIAPALADFIRLRLLPETKDQPVAK